MMCILGIVSLSQFIAQVWPIKLGTPRLYYIAPQNSLSLFIAYTSFSLALFQLLTAGIHSLSYLHLNMVPEVFTFLYHDMSPKFRAQSHSCSHCHPPPCALSWLPTEDWNILQWASIQRQAGKKRSSIGCWQIRGTELQPLGKDANLLT